MFLRDDVCQVVQEGGVALPDPIQFSAHFMHFDSVKSSFHFSGEKGKFNAAGGWFDSQVLRDQIIRKTFEVEDTMVPVPGFKFGQFC